MPNFQKKIVILKIIEFLKMSIFETWSNYVRLNELHCENSVKVLKHFKFLNEY